MSSATSTRSDASEDEQSTVSRRGFLRGAGGTAGAIASGGAAVGRADAQETSTVTVEMTDELVFAPDEIAIPPGTTIVWQNVGTIGHSVTAYEDELPEGVSYFASGEFESEDAARSAYTAGEEGSGDVAGGESFQQTFETTGTIEYFCIPHESVGMLGTIEVSEDASLTTEAGGGGPSIPQVSGTARTIAVAVAAVVVATLGFTYFFLKYGGQYGVGDEEER